LEKYEKLDTLTNLKTLGYKMERNFYFFTAKNLRYFLAEDKNGGYYLENNVFAKTVLKFATSETDTRMLEKQYKTILEIWELNISKIKMSADIKEYEINIGSEF
jgi:hypothetical protein